jgi:hypothetical protein
MAEKFFLYSFRKKFFIAILLWGVSVLIIIGLRLWLLIPLLIIAIFIVALYALASLGARPLFQFIYWSFNKQKLLGEYPGKYRISIYSLGLAQEELRNLQAEIDKNNEAIIADIDKDGYLFSRYGQFAGVSFVSQKEFIPRKRNKLRLIAVGDQVGVRKPSATMKGFLSELTSLFVLREHCNVPAILGVDFRKFSIDISFIPGVVLAQELANRGARVRHRDLENDRGYNTLSREAQKQSRIESTRPILNDYVSVELKDAIFSELKQIHKLGILVKDIKYGNIILEEDSGRPFFIDFDYAQGIGFPGGLRGEVKRDSEIKQFNYVFDTEKPTRNIMLEKIKKVDDVLLEAENVSVIIGRGLGFGRSWDVTFGEGLWYYLLNPNLPDMTGLRILDISDMDPLFPLRMVLDGAAEVLRIHDNDRWNQYTGFLKEAFEWVNSSTIRFSVMGAILDDLPSHQLDPFDLVFASKNIFQKTGQGLIQLIHYFLSLGVKTIIICVEHAGAEINDKGGGTDYKSQISIMKKRGYKIVRDVSRPGCNHQLLIFELQG